MPATGQVLELSAVTTTMTNDVRFSGVRTQHAGLWTGGEATLGLSALRISLSSAFGSLNGAATDVDPNRRMRVTGFSLGLAPSPAMTFAASAEARRFDTDAGWTVWRLIGG